MKSIKKLLLITILSIGFVLPSCNKDHFGTSCDDVDFEASRYFDIQGLTAFWYEADTLYNFNQINPTDSILLPELGGLFMEYEVEYHASTSNFTPSFSLMSSALACSYLPGYDGSKTEKLTDLSIITLNDFDEEHLANSSLNDLIDFQGDYLFSQENSTLADYLLNQTENIKSQYLILQLNKAPTLDQEVRVKIVINLSTTERYEEEIAPITFKS